jgi:2-polyprenyl-6-methoxyphenol hydroxylase-like FAD-dependent oxidoreductase
MEILVIGGGVGGLAVARAMLANGHQVSVYERAPTLRTGGAGVTIFSNGHAVLDDLGVSLEGIGGRIDTLDMMTADGRLRMRQNLAHAADRYGFETKTVARRHLLERLAAGLPDDLVRFGMGCTGLSQDGDRVGATFEDGSTATGDVLIGADGHHSVVRRHLWGDGRVHPATYGTWQGLSEIDVELTRSTRALMITGREGACGLMPAGGGLLQWWFDVRWTPSRPRPAAPLDALRRRFRGWASPVPEVLDAAREEDLDFFGHHWNRVPPVWGKGRISVVGDAAHTMPPTLAQGANQTLEDAWVLGREFAGDGFDPVQRLRAFERARYPHISLVSRMTKHSPSNRRYPRLLGRLVPETLQTGMLKRFSNRLSA